MLYELGGTASRIVNDIKHLAALCMSLINAALGVTWFPSFQLSVSISVHVLFFFRFFFT